MLYSCGLTMFFFYFVDCLLARASTNKPLTNNTRRIHLRIPILSFPWTCWKCKKEMKVIYPTSEDVYETEFRGNLAPTYSKTQRKQVIGNLCPHCGGYQGNYFVWDDGLIEHAYELENYLVGFFEVKTACLVCGKDLEDNCWGDFFSKLNAYEDYHEVQNLNSSDKKKEIELRTERADSSWLCHSCHETESAKRRETWRKERLQQIRDGPLIQCSLCKRNTKENPETEFEEHHLSYFPEEKIAVCPRCHMKIHHSDAYPEFKPKDKRISAKERSDLEKLEKIEKAKKDRTLTDKFCPVCGKNFKQKDAFTFYRGTKTHIKCLPREGRQLKL